MTPTKEELDRKLLAYVEGHHRLDREEIRDLRVDIHHMQVRLAVIDKTLEDLDEEVTDAGQDEKAKRKKDEEKIDWWKRQSILWIVAIVAAIFTFGAGFLSSHLTWH